MENGVSERHTLLGIGGRSESLPGDGGSVTPTTLTEAVCPGHPGPAPLPGPHRLLRVDLLVLTTSCTVEIERNWHYLRRVFR